MANVQVENGYTVLAHEIIEALYAHDFTAREFRIVLFLIRRTYGWKRAVDTFSVKELSGFLGLSYERTREALVDLVERRVIKVVKPAKFNQTASYAFEKNWEAWTVGKSGCIGPERPNSPRKRSLPPKTITPPENLTTDQNATHRCGDSEILGGSPRKRSLPPKTGEGVPPKTGDPEIEIEQPEPQPKAIKTQNENLFKTIGKLRKEIYKESPDQDPRGAIPPNPPELIADAQEPGSDEEGPLLAVCLETLRGLGKLTRPQEQRITEKVRAIYRQHGLAILAAAVREAARNAIFTRANPKPGKKPWSVMATFTCVLDTHVSGAVAQAKANQRTAKRRAEERLPARPPKRYEYLPESGWVYPPELVGDPGLNDTPLARFVLARLAGLPVGGAGPGPPASPDPAPEPLDDLEDPHGT